MYRCLGAGELGARPGPGPLAQGPEGLQPPRPPVRPTGTRATSPGAACGCKACSNSPCWACQRRAGPHQVARRPTQPPAARPPMPPRLYARDWGAGWHRRPFQHHCGNHGGWLAGGNHGVHGHTHGGFIQGHQALGDGVPGARHGHRPAPAPWRPARVGAATRLQNVLVRPASSGKGIPKRTARPG